MRQHNNLYNVITMTLETNKLSNIQTKFVCLKFIFEYYQELKFFK